MESIIAIINSRKGSLGGRKSRKAGASKDKKKIRGETVNKKDSGGEQSDKSKDLDKATTTAATKGKKSIGKGSRKTQAPKYRRKPDRALNVRALQAPENISRKELLTWVNVVLHADFKKVEELCTGAAYCNFMDMLFPGSIKMKNVKLRTNITHEFIRNFELLQAAFKKIGVKQRIPIDNLIRGKSKDNFEFLKWFKKLFDDNYDGRLYDAISARNYAPLGMGERIMKTTGGLTARKRQSETLIKPPRSRLSRRTPKKSTRSIKKGYKLSCLSPRAPKKSTRSIKKICKVSEPSKTVLKQQNEELTPKVRNIYKKKLHEIEVVCRKNNNDHKLLAQQIIQRIFEILYNSDDVVGSSEEFEEEEDEAC